MRYKESQVVGVFNQTLSSQPWSPPGVSLIAARRMWPTTQGKGVVIAVLDTGIDDEHPDLQGKVVGGRSFVPGEADYRDENGHGTHVAGTIAAHGKILGVAPQASLLAAKVLNRYGAGSYVSIRQGLAWARNWEGKNGERVNIVNLSLGGPLPNSGLHEEIKKVVAAGITVVCAAGNSGDGKPGTPEISYPAYYQETVAVGAVNLKTGIANFSNSNDRIDIVAPGVNTYSTYPGGRYVELSGTSMATPHISGALALICSRYHMRFHAYPSPAFLNDLLHYMAIDLGQIGFDKLFGYGLFSFNLDGGKSILLTAGRKEYQLNDRNASFQMAPFIYEKECCTSIVEISELLGCDAAFLHPNGANGSESGQVQIWD